MEGRAPRTLFESDFLLLVDDELRTGALRFRTDPDGPFLAEPRPGRGPPLARLDRLLDACNRVTRRDELDEDLRLLIGPGSSLGAARPKAAIRDRDGALAIAKFPHADDDRDIVLWEAVALELADRAGIAVPDWRIERVAGRRVLVVRRFDRRGGSRVPFLSAMSMLGAADNERLSYLEIADALRSHGAAPRRDLQELWRRVVFSVLVSNTDDHLRNHGFLYERDKGWRLSPAFDLNPAPTDERARVLATNIDEHDGTASLDLALGTATYYGLDPGDAGRIAGEVGRAVGGWREVAGEMGATRRESDRMESAFSHEDLEGGARVGLGPPGPPSHPSSAFCGRANALLQRIERQHRTPHPAGKSPYPRQRPQVPQLLRELGTIRGQPLGEGVPQIADRADFLPRHQRGEHRGSRLRDGAAAAVEARLGDETVPRPVPRFSPCPPQKGLWAWPLVAGGSRGPRLRGRRK